eukprot:1159880-Pelagomonas_calceolata.AAC.10
MGQGIVELSGVRPEQGQPGILSALYIKIDSQRSSSHPRRCKLYQNMQSRHTFSALSAPWCAILRAVVRHSVQHATMSAAMADAVQPVKSR